MNSISTSLTALFTNFDAPLREDDTTPRLPEAKALNGDRLLDTLGGDLPADIPEAFRVFKHLPDDLLPGEDLLDDSPDIPEVLARPLDDLPLGVAPLDEPLKARPLEADSFSDGTELLLTADLLSKGDLDLNLDDFPNLDLPDELLNDPPAFTLLLEPSFSAFPLSALDDDLLFDLTAPDLLGEEAAADPTPREHDELEILLHDDDDSNLESTSWLTLNILDDELDVAPDLADDLDTVLETTLDAVLKVDLELALVAVLRTDLEADPDVDLDPIAKNLAASPCSS